MGQLTRHQIVLCISSTKRGRSIAGAWPMQRVTAALCGAISILFAGCSTIVKGTEQQVSVNTPGVPGALCQLQSPAIGTRTVQTTCEHHPAQEQEQRRRLLRRPMLQPGRRHACLAYRSYGCRQCAVRGHHRPRHRCSLGRHEHLRSWRRGRHDALPGCGRPPRKGKGVPWRARLCQSDAARLGLPLRQRFR